MEKAQLADLWKFPWPVMDVLIGGQSSIDLPELRVPTWDEATSFLRSYGFDPDSERDARRMHAIIVEALAFVERVLLSPREWAKGVKPPEEILTCMDPRHLLIWASSTGPSERLKRAWSCAVLRVMHTIAHIEGVNRYINIGEARSQIMARFRRYIVRDDDKNLWFGEGINRVKLERVEWKERKTRTSILLKLLHKRDNVAETIYDYLGMRVVTTRLCDVMMVVKFLREFHIVSYPNNYPSRARNNLIDTERFRAQVEALRDMLTAGSLSPEDFESMVARVTAPSHANVANNPHSAASYRAIQMTCRQLVEIKNPQFAWLDRLEREVDASLAGPATAKVLGELRQLVAGWYAVKGERTIRSFVPFEIQIMDPEAHAQASAGTANHDRYKLSQVRAARKRVLHKVLTLS